MSDLISRQSAIDALNEVSEHYTNKGREWHPHINFMVDAIRDLPSAQPSTQLIAEIKVSKENIEELLAEIDDFPSAQPEQKTGKAEKLSYALTNSAFCNPPINTAVGYVPPLKKTNADRIRSMTDEELAEFFVAIQNDVADYYDGGHAFEPDFPTHKDAWLEWLKAEVKE